MNDESKDEIVPDENKPDQTGDLLDALKSSASHLAAAISLLKRGKKKAAPSDIMFDMMISDYEKCMERSRELINSVQDGIEDKRTMRSYAERYPDNVVLSTNIWPCGVSGVTVKWSVKNVGFGEFNFSRGENGKMEIWNECMGPMFIKHVLNHLVDNGKLMEP